MDIRIPASPILPRCSARLLAAALVPKLEDLKLEQISIDKARNLIYLGLKMIAHKAVTQ
jgi:hypothetical protein